MLLAATLDVFALSETLYSAKIFYPKGYDADRAKQIDQVLTDKQFKFLTGLTSYWEPEFSTTLVYEGDAGNLNAFVLAMHKLDRVNVRLSFSPDLSKETGSALTAGSWWVKYRHTEPNMIEIRINLAAPTVAKFSFDLPK